MKQTKGKQKRNRNHATQKEEAKNGENECLQQTKEESRWEKTEYRNKPTDNVYA
jgi:hypothetical protein